MSTLPSGWLLLVLFAAASCRGAAADTFDSSRIPAGSGWECWTGHCSRRCEGRPGAELPDGTHPEPVCQRVPVASCTTYVLDRRARWECFPDAVACGANQRHYLAEAKDGRDYSRVSSCTAVP